MEMSEMNSLRDSSVLASSHRRVLRPQSVMPPPTSAPELQQLHAPQRQYRNGLYSPTAFDTNVVIVTAALLCVLVCALGINSFVRCMLHCSQRMAFESAEEAELRRKNTGMKKNQVKSLPMVVFSNGQVAAETGLDQCSICLAEFAEGESLRVLPKCKHAFHIMCVDKWLLLHSSCPTCRQGLLGAKAPKKVPEVQVVIAIAEARASVARESVSPVPTCAANNGGEEEVAEKITPSPACATTQRAEEDVAVKVSPANNGAVEEDVAVKISPCPACSTTNEEDIALQP